MKKTLAEQFVDELMNVGKDKVSEIVKRYSDSSKLSLTLVRKESKAETAMFFKDHSVVLTNEKDGHSFTAEFIAEILLENV